MNQRIIKITAISTLIAVAIIIYSAISIQKRLVGEPVFQGLYENPHQIDKISFTYPDQTMTLHIKDNLWRVEEANDYYTNYLFVNQLLVSFKYARFFERVDELNDLEEGTRLVITSKNGEVLSDITMGETIADDAYTFVKINNTNEVYLATDLFDFPDDVGAWLQQPLVRIDMDDIENIKIDDIVIKKDNKLSKFTIDNNEINIKPIRQIFSYMYFEKPVQETDFDESLYPNKKTFSLTSFEGLIQEVIIFSNNEEYWVKKKISSTKLPTAGINDYINNNSFLYDGWYFRIPKRMGQDLFNYKAEKVEHE